MALRGQMATGRALIQIKPHFIWLRHGCDCRESDALGQIRFALDTHVLDLGFVEVG
jgi:hypothetical protein